MKIQCEDAQGMAVQHPDTFEVADIDHLREIIKPGVYAKIAITSGQYGAERIWTDIVSVDGVKVKATLANDPMSDDMEHGDPVEYELRHIYNVTTHDGEEIA